MPEERGRNCARAAEERALAFAHKLEEVNALEPLLRPSRTKERRAASTL